MHGRKANATATMARMSRSRSSSKCEISVPSTSFSGSSAMGRSIRRIGGRLRWLVWRVVRRAHPTDPVLLPGCSCRGLADGRRNRAAQLVSRVSMRIGVRIDNLLLRFGGRRCRSRRGLASTRDGSRLRRLGDGYWAGLGSGHRGHRRRYWRGRRAGCGSLRLSRLFEIDLFFKLLAELAGHSPRTAYPPADLGSDLGQLLGSQHHEGQDENNENLRESDVEHAVAARRPRKAQTLRSVFWPASRGAAFGASAKSASVPSERIRGGGGEIPSSSPSFIDFLKPRTAAPRSDPIVRSFLAPNTKSTTSRITTSSRIPIPISFNSR